MSRPGAVSNRGAFHVVNLWLSLEPRASLDRRYKGVSKAYRVPYRKTLISITAYSFLVEWLKHFKKNFRREQYFLQQARGPDQNHGP